MHIFYVHKNTYKTLKHTVKHKQTASQQENSKKGQSVPIEHKKYLSEVLKQAKKILIYARHRLCGHLMAKTITFLHIYIFR